MSGHLPVLDRGATVLRRARTGHTAGLDAWLGTDGRPTDTGTPATVDDHADWNAPSCQVELAYDTADQGLPFGVRAVVQEGSRRLMFEAREYEIIVQVASHHATERHELVGQVLFEGLPLPGAKVRLDVAGSGATCRTDGAGGFRLPPLHRGAYGLSIAVTGAVLTVPPIALF